MHLDANEIQCVDDTGGEGLTSAFTSTECFSSSLLSHSLADDRRRLTDSQMSSSLTTVTTVLTGANYREWHVSMCAYLQSTGTWWTIREARPAADAESWDGDNEKAMGTITLHCTAPIKTQVAEKTTTKQIWDLLKDLYGQPSVGSAHTELKKLLATNIPSNSHPAPALRSIAANFAYLKEAGFEISLPVQTMILVVKLPSSMEVVAQLINQTKPVDIKSLKPDEIIAVATLAFEQRSQRSTTGNGHQANKLSKQADPKFAQQQQQAPRPQQQQGGGGQSGNAPTNHGDKCRRGGKKACARCEAANAAQFAAFIHTNGPEPCVDPHALAHTPGGAHYGPPAFNLTLRSIDLAHRIGVEATPETVCTLETVVQSTAEEPEPGPSVKHPRLEERLTSVYDEDTVSLGDDDDNPFADMYDELDGMVLDRYNATSMDIGTEANLFRSVPSSPKQAADTNYMLDVHFTPALYVASSRLYNTLMHSANAICFHEVHDARCVKCKGKKADGSKLQGAFWLLDSGASRHFTGNRDDFADYQVLDYKLYAKTANSKAEIVGVGTVLLRTVDHNGEEAIVTLAQVLHMPSANARLISMGEFLTSGYSIRGNKSGLQLYNSVASLWFGPDPENLRCVTYGIRSIPTIRSNYIASVSKVNYDIMHRRFGHPSKAVLRHVQKHTQRFPEIHFPTEDCICPGCALGKMSNRAFPENPQCASKAFELVHSDLKSFPVPSYRKYKYIITFYDDFTSHA